MNRLRPAAPGAYHPLMRRPARLAVLLAALLATEATSRADEPEAKTLAVLIHGGDVDLMIESLVRVTAEGALAQVGFEVAAPSVAGGADAAKLSGCAGDQRCWQSHLSAAEVPRVMLLSLAQQAGSGQEGQALSLTGHLITAPGGEQMSTVTSTYEEPCDAERLTATVEALTLQLVRESRERAPVTPPVAVDPGPQAGPPSSGQGLSDTPMAQASVTATDPQARPFRFWKFAALTAGVLAIGGGATLVAIDGPQIEDGVRQPTERASRLQGYGLMGAGVVLVATGVTLWVVDNRSTGVGAAPTSGGGSVMMWGRF